MTTALVCPAPARAVRIRVGVIAGTPGEAVITVRSSHPLWRPPARMPGKAISCTKGRRHGTARHRRGLLHHGIPLTSVRVMGGGQRSDLWRHIVADATGLPLTTCDIDEVSAMGAAAQAIAYITGDPLDDTARRLAKLGAVTEPDETAHAIYEELSAIQEDVYERLSPTFAAQHAFAARHPL
ncbi:MAG TPA: FGGY-family carbohydrate kinase [Propionibacteriaceae bacterium]